MRRQGMSLWDLTSDDLIEGEQIEVTGQTETATWTLTVGPRIEASAAPLEVFHLRPRRHADTPDDAG